MSFRCIQVNLHHATSASMVLSRRFSKEHLNIALIQEPWIRKGTVKGLSQAGELIYNSSGIKPRACIIVQRGSKFLPIPGFCNDDLVAVMLEFDEGDNHMRAIFASAYFPGESNQPPPARVVNLIDHCRRENLQLILGCDANAHHIIWGSSNTNERGEYLLDFIVSNDLHILNIGNKPTFVTRNRKEVLDLTLGTGLLAAKVKNWHVSNEPSMSDHRHIRFDIDIRPNDLGGYRAVGRTDWRIYKEHLSDSLQQVVTSVKTIEDIETAVEQIQAGMINAFYLSCPLRTRETTRNVPWWNRKLSKLRANTRKLFNRAKKTSNWEEYTNALTEYNRELRRSKRRSWRSLCENIDGTHQCSRLHKILSKEPSRTIGLMEKPDGSYTESAKETLELLARTHFPGSSIIGNNNFANLVLPRQPGRPSKEHWRMASKIFKPAQIRWAIGSFKPLKSAGVDGIFPALLQKGIEELIPTLIKVFRASFAWGHIPSAWTEAKVMYIPKAGRRPSHQPRSYRPISLTSFMLKTMEKIVDRHIRDGVLLRKPLHPKQYAYQQGKSTEAALINLINEIEPAIDNKEIALCAFLDIEGAFDNTSVESILTSLERKGIEICTCGWIKALLTNRKITSTLLNEKLTIETTKGCPQGGVLSPLLWSLVVDELLSQLNDLGITTQGYADDLVLIVKGKYENTLFELLQYALNLVRHWCLEHKLSVNPGKTTIVPFTRRRKMEQRVKPHLFGTEIPLSHEVKYLGVTLDAKLNWNLHLERTLQKASIALFTCQRLVGRTWGLKPKYMLWMYTNVVRPIISYASIAWWGKCKQKTARDSLYKFQRMACLFTTGAMRTTPTRALETLLNLPPLHIIIGKEARASMYRALTEDQTGKSWNCKSLSSLRMQTMNDPTLGMVSDRMSTKYDFEKPFKVEIPKRSNTSLNFECDALVWYTDGSKTEEGVGSGIYGERPRAKITQSLGKLPSIFQAEVYAINSCAYENLRRSYHGKKIYILSDSQAALKAVASPEIKSKLVWECVQTLKALASRNSLTLTWVPGHSGVPGNEEADALAREGAKTPFSGPEPFCGISISTAKKSIKTWAASEWDQERNQNPRYTHASKFISEPSQQKARKLLELTKNRLRIVTGVLTGHCRLNKHMHRLKLASTTLCRLCLEEEETAEHILCYCEAIARTRFLLLGGHPLTPRDFERFSPKEILSLLERAGLVETL